MSKIQQQIRTFFRELAYDVYWPGDVQSLAKSILGLKNNNDYKDLINLKYHPDPIALEKFQALQGIEKPVLEKQALELRKTFLEKRYKRKDNNGPLSEDIMGKLELLTQRIRVSTLGHGCWGHILDIDYADVERLKQSYLSSFSDADQKKIIEFAALPQDDQNRLEQKEKTLSYCRGALVSYFSNTFSNAFSTRHRNVHTESLNTLLKTCGMVSGQGMDFRVLATKHFRDAQSVAGSIMEDVHIGTALKELGVDDALVFIQETLQQISMQQE